MFSRIFYELRHTGAFTAFRIYKIPVRLNWSLILLVFPFFGHRSFSASLTIIGIILVHELGHALMVKMAGCRNKEIMLHLMGGYCKWEGRATTLQTLLIAWGGIFAQLVILLGCGILKLSYPELTAFYKTDIWSALTFYNGIMVAINLIPVKALDGGKCWYLFPYLRIRYLISKENKGKGIKPELEIDDDQNFSEYAQFNDKDVDKLVRILH